MNSKKIREYFEQGGRKFYIKGHRNIITFTSWTEGFKELHWDFRGHSTFSYFRDIDKRRTIKLIGEE